MSTLQKPKNTKRNRPRDELEGALLPPAPAPIPIDDPLRLPIASAVPDSSVAPAATAAATSAATITNEASSPATHSMPVPASTAALPANSAADIPTVAAVPVVAAVPIGQFEYPSQDLSGKEKEDIANRGQAAAAAAGELGLGTPGGTNHPPYRHPVPATRLDRWADGGVDPADGRSVARE